MMILCPECKLQVSDKALACPHCGYPFRPEAKREYNHRKRLPNGFGQITKIKGKSLRNPYRAMITIGKDESNKPITKMLKPQSYFKTYNEAYEALVEYNRNPYNVELDPTMNELYERWFKDTHKDEKSYSRKMNIKNSWEYCRYLHNIKVRDLRPSHIMTCYNESSATPVNKQLMKSTLTLVLDYGIQLEIIDKNYARLVKLDDKVLDDIKKERKSHINFTKEEMKKLWKNINNIDGVDMILFQCYTGWRPQEMCKLKLENINIEKKYMIGGLKTAAGTNRRVPIHESIMEIAVNRYNRAFSTGSEYLFNTNKGKPYTYLHWDQQFNNIIKQLELNPDHRPHDGRVTFISICKEYNVDEYAIKRIVGHEISDITEKVYTRREDSWLNDEINKIKV